jgi:Tfp pilus assembly protein PilZ
MEHINIGLGGLRIRGDDVYRVGAPLSLDIFLFPRTAPVKFTTEIMWIAASRTGGRERFDVGLAFVDLGRAALSLLLSALTCEGESVDSARPPAQKAPTPMERRFGCSLDEPASEVRGVAPESATVRRGDVIHSMLFPVLLVNDAELRGLPLDGRLGFLVSLIDGVTSVESLIDLSGMPPDETLAMLDDLRLRQIVELS